MLLINNLSTQIVTHALWFYVACTSIVVLESTRPNFGSNAFKIYEAKMHRVSVNHKVVILWRVVIVISISGSRNCQQLEETKDREFLKNFSATSHNYPLSPEESEVPVVFSILSGLNEALHPLLDKNCLLHLTRYQSQHLDFGEAPKFPWILRHLSSHKLSYFQKYRTRGGEFVEKIEKLIWVMNGVNTNTYTDSLPSCSNSPYIGIGNEVTICANLNSSTFTLKSKPWQCEVFLGLFPKFVSFDFNKIYSNLLYYPPVWQYDSIRSHWSLPGSVIKFNVLVVTAKMHRTHLERDNYRNWARQYFGQTFNHGQKSQINLLPISTDAFLIFETKTFSSTLQPSQEIISCFWKFGICLNCDERIANLSLKFLHEIRSERFYNLSSIRDLLYHYTLNSEAVVESRWDITREDSTIESIKYLKYFEDCDQDEFRTAFAPTAMDLQMRSLVHIWHTVMTNFSHPNLEGYGDYITCLSGIGKKRLEEPISPYTSIVLLVQVRLSMDVPEAFTISFPNDITTLRFVSCGRPKPDVFAFRELLNVFDGYIWVAFLVTVAVTIMFTISYVKKETCSNLSSLEITMEYFKIFVEFDSTLALVCTAHKWRIFIIVYMLMNIILSNGYRNANVYNMIQPREPIPYELFTQLVTDNFKIFTRNVGDMVSRGWSANEEPLNLTKVEETPHSFILHNKDIFVGSAWSEIKMIEDATLRQGRMETYDNEKFARLKNHSSLHPDLILLCYETAREYLKEKKVNSRGEVDRPHLLQELEQLMLEKSLRSCDQIALLLPDHLSRHLARKVRDKKHLYVGKESLQEYVLGFKLQGYVPLKILGRLRAITWAGIWDRWEKLLESKTGKPYKSNREPEGLHAATMSGNIIIIFALLVSGEIISIGVFLMECLKLDEMVKRLYRTSYTHSGNRIDVLHVG